MFRYNANQNLKSGFNKMEYLVEGWKEKDLLKNLGNEGRYFEITAGEGVTVIMDIHFLESLMVALNHTGDLYEGLEIKENKQARVDLNSFAPLFNFLKNHNSKQDLKMPSGSLDLLMLCFSYAPQWLEAINEFEIENPEMVMKTKKLKEEFLLKRLEEEFQTNQKRISEHFEKNRDKIKEFYDKAINEAISRGRYDIALQLEGAEEKKTDVATTEYGERILKSVENYNFHLEKISEKTTNTYAFGLDKFDVLVSKTNETTLKLKTIYPPVKYKEPDNCYLYILDYGDKRKIPKF